MLIAAIALILLVVGGVGTMSVVMQENAEVANEVIVVANHVDERIQEEVDITRDSGGLQLLNAGPEIEILEYRVLDGAGTLMKSCPASLDVGASQRKTVDSTEQELKGCWDEYDDPAELFQIVTARGKVFTLSESGSGNITTTIIIDNSTHTVINNTQTVNSAGALGTSGRMVPTPLYGYVVYGDDQGEPGIVKEATTFNYYTGSIDYVGVIPNKNNPTKSYSLDSPYGAYHATSSVLEPAGSPVNVNVVGNKILEGNAPAIRDYGREVEVDVNGKVLVQLDGSNFGNRAAISVNTGNVTVQIIMSPNDLVGADYRDFNGTVKFVLFEGAAQHGPLELAPFKLHPQISVPLSWRCELPCFNFGGIYAVDTGRDDFRGGDIYNLYAGTQRAIPNILDVYVTNATESLHSNATLSVTNGYKSSLRSLHSTTNSYDGVFAVNATFVDGLWRITGLAEEAPYDITTRYNRNSGSAQGYAAAHGTHIIADATPYLVNGNVEPFDSKSVNIVPDSNVYVLLDGVGTVLISAANVVASNDIDVSNLPGTVPWIFETGDGELLHAGITTPSGTVTIPLPDYSAGDGNIDFALLIYEDGFGDNVWFDDMVVDVRNEETIRRDFGHPTYNVIYVPEMYMLYPMTVPVNIDDVRLGKLSTDCSVTDQVRLRYLDNAYAIGSSMYVPFVPEMSVLKMSIDGAPVCIKFADVVPPVQVVPFRGDRAAGKNATMIDLDVNGRASTILSTDDPTSVVVSFSASGFSEHARRTTVGTGILTGEDGASKTCIFIHGSPFTAGWCPPPANTMLHTIFQHRPGTIEALERSFTKYEVTVDVFKNGQLYDTVILPINSLSAEPPLDIGATFGFTPYTTPGWNTDIPLSINQTTVSGDQIHGNPYGSVYSRLQLASIAKTSWSEFFTHTFDIHDGKTGDHIEVQISNEVTFRFPYSYGHYHPYNSGKCSRGLTHF